VVSHGRYVTFQMAEVAVPKQMLREILSLIAIPKDAFKRPPPPEHDQLWYILVSTEV
jgi:hypothetical protein